MSTAYVVGGGLAGLSAAVTLAQQGRKVVLIEGAPQAGGRCRSYFDPVLDGVIDNGNHFVLSGNRAVMSYLAVTGGLKGLIGPEKSRTSFVDIATGKRWTIAPDEGPIPFWLFDASRRVPDTTPADYLPLFKLLFASPTQRIGELLPAHGHLWERLLHPFFIGALNTEPETASAQLAGALVRETFAKGGRAYRIRVAHPTLAAVFVDPALVYLESKGADIRIGQRVRALTFDDWSVTGLDVAGTTVAIGRNDTVIVAVPPWAATELIPDLVVPTEFRAIVNAHFKIAAPPGLPPMLGLIGGLVQWIFPFEDRISITVSGADAIVDDDRETLARRFWADVAKVLQLPEDLPPWQVVKERRATFAATPDQALRRPATGTRWSNLLLAGDWTDTGLPATIEGAIRSGNKAAALALKLPPPLEGGSKNSERSEEFLGEGSRLGAEPLPEICCSNFDPPSRGGWAIRRYMNQMLVGHEGTIAVDKMLGDATEGLLKSQRADGHWVFELEADATIPSEYVLLVHYLAETPNLELEKKIGNYLRRIQSAEHGGWPLYHGGVFDISATVKAYFALKMIGDDIDAPHMVRAREAIRSRGGAIKANVFTRILLALYGETAWLNVPTVPVELILLPRWFPIHLSKMSYWARTVIVPLLVLAAMQPLARNPRNIHVPELFVEGVPVVSPRAPHQSAGWSFFFNMLDKVLKVVPWPKGLRQRAIDTCVAWTTERLNGEDGLGAIYPAMANSVMMYDVMGVPEADPRRAIARKSVDLLLVVKESEAYCQPCVSPVWDTALAAHALMEAKTDTADAAVSRSLEWLKTRQVLDVKGDWAEERPNVRPGGWAFQYNNAYYPDLDDTAVVVMALNRAAPDSYKNEIARGREWVEGLQSKNGGWGAFDADNAYYYLNNIPFADHGALLDPPTDDVSGRCIGMLMQLGATPDDPHVKAGVDFLRKSQLADGSWFGRWGVNYIYGTWSALAGLNAAHVMPDDPMMTRAADWLVKIQNEDGGWGEDCNSYRLDYKGYEPAPSTASQTAWALLALMAAGQVDSPAVARGIRHLEATQAPDGLWEQAHYTGGGFPRVFYLRYHGYPKFFPLWAVARYRNLKAGNSRHVAYGL